MSEDHQPTQPDSPNGPEDADEDSSGDLTAGPVWRGLLSMAGPMLIGMISVMSMSVIDTYFVGQLGTLPLAAMGFSFPVIFFVGGITMGLSTGASSVISRAVGRGDTEDVRRLATHVLLLGVTLVSVTATGGYIFMEPIFRLLGASGEAMPLIREYMTVWFFGMVFLVIPVLGNSAIRARGDAKTPMYVMIGITGINLVLDPILIFGLGPMPKLGIMGAALATAIARGVATLATLWILAARENMILVGRGALDRLFRSWGQLLRIGGPAAATNVITPVTTAILTRMVSSYGAAAVAAYGAGTRIESLALLVPMSLGAGLGPFVGQNWGAGEAERVDDAQKLSEKVALGWGALSWVVFTVGGAWIATSFVEGAEAAEHLQTFLWIVPLGHGLQGVFIAANSTLNAIDRPIHAAVLSVTRTLVLTAPAAWLASLWFGLEGIFASIAAANAVVGIAAALVVHRMIRSAQTASGEGRLN